MLYLYKAVDAAGHMISGTLDASTEDAAAAELSRRQMVPVQLRTQGGGRWQALHQHLGWRQRLSVRDLLAMTQGLAALLKADLTVDRALDLLARTSERPGIRRCCSEWGRRVREGATLAEALE